jgi:ferritin-like metal-binding protein YciE
MEDIMTTFVGTQDSLIEALQSLMDLDYDALEAYDASIHRLQNSDYKAKLEEFKSDHQRHIEDLTKVLKGHDITPATGPSAKQWLTKGKVVIANIMGDEGVLKAMLSNEGDTNTAYEKMNDRKDLWDDLKDVLKKGLNDERKHKMWLEEVVGN